MKRIAKFEKVSFEEFMKAIEDIYPDWDENYIRRVYDDIVLPKRATSGSAGYDFFMPYSATLFPNDTIKVPTGIRCKMDEGWVLKAYPRSGHGFKFGVRLANTVGIIDSDYYYSDNEGHMFMKLVNSDPVLSKPIELKEGTAFCQGIFSEYGITVDDEATAVRNGGFGSTTKKK